MPFWKLVFLAVWPGAILRPVISQLTPNENNILLSTMIQGKTYYCQDLPSVVEKTKYTCDQLKNMLPGGCSYILADAGVVLPPELPSNSTLVVVCPNTCGYCEQTCNKGCAKWFLGNGYCDPACNTASCNYDNGDCRQSASSAIVLPSFSSQKASTALITPPTPFTVTVADTSTDISIKAASLQCPDLSTTYVNDSCLACEDVPLVQETMKQSCAQLVGMVTCTFLLSSYPSLPVALPPTATLATICPGTCGLCAMECAPECPNWFLGNGYCDPNCNSAACEYDGGDCEPSTETPTTAPTTSPTTAPTVAPTTRPMTSPAAAPASTPTAAPNNPPSTNSDKNCNGDVLKKLDFTRYSIDVMGNDYSNGAKRVITCQKNFFPPNYDDPYIGSTIPISQTITCRGGVWDTITLRCLSSQSPLYVGRIVMQSSNIRAWDATVIPSIFQALLSSLAISSYNQELFLRRVNLGLPGEAGETSGDTAPVCEDSPLVAQSGVSCADILTRAGGDFVCAMTLETVAKAGGSTAIIPPDFKTLLVKDACPVSCKNCPTRRLLSRLSDLMDDDGDMGSDCHSQSCSLRRNLQQLTSKVSVGWDDFSTPAEHYVDVEFAVKSPARPFAVDNTTANRFFESLKAVFERTNLSFLDETDPRKTVSATSFFTISSNVRMEVSSIKTETVEDVVIQSSYLSSALLQDYSRVTSILSTAPIMGVPKFSLSSYFCPLNANSYNSMSPSSSSISPPSSCCDLPSRMHQFFKGECGKLLFAGRVREQHIQYFCSGNLLSTNSDSCISELNQILSLYDGLSSPSCTVLSSYKVFASSICNTNPVDGSMCLTSLTKHVKEFKLGLSELNGKEAAELDEICLENSCYRSNVRYISSLTYISNGASGYATGELIGRYRTTEAYLSELTEDLIDTVCIQVDGIYCQNMIQKILMSNILSSNSNSSASFASLCNNRCITLKTSQLGGVAVHYGLSHISPYHVYLGTLMRSFGRFACLDEVGGRYSLTNGKYCGDLIFSSKSSINPPSTPPPSSDLSYCGCPQWYVGDGQCDPSCFTENCNWDGGDCEPSFLFPNYVGTLETPFPPKCYPPSQPTQSTNSLINISGANEKYVCSDSCLQTIRSGLEHNGCCVSAAVEVRRELYDNKVFMQNFFDAKWSAPFASFYTVSWNNAVIEQSCSVSMDRTCSMGSTRQLLKLDFVINNLNYSKITSASVPHIDAIGSQVARTIAEELGFAYADVTRILYRQGELSSVIVLVEVDANDYLVYLSLRWFDDPKNLDQLARKIETALYMRPFLIANEWRTTSNAPVVVTPGIFNLLTRQLQSPGVSNRVSNSLPYIGTQGMQTYSSRLLEETCNNQSLQIFAANYTITSVSATVKNVVCATGYSGDMSGAPAIATMPTKSDTLTCVNGIWVQRNYLSCRKNCPSTHPDIPSPSIGYMVTVPSVSHGSKMNVSCLGGYAPDVYHNSKAAQLVQCTHGEWEPLLVQCKKTCNEVKLLNHNYYVVSPGSLAEGATREISCKEGYVHSPFDKQSITVKCEKGEWKFEDKDFLCLVSKVISPRAAHGGFLTFLMNMFLSLGVIGWVSLFLLTVLSVAVALWIWHKFASEKANRVAKGRAEAFRKAAQQRANIQP